MTTLTPDARRATARLALVAPRGRRTSYAIVASVVGLWMAIGWALHLGAVPYLLLGIPLTIAFQVGIARRSIRSLWLADDRPFRLDRVALGLAMVLAALPAYATVSGLAAGRLLDVGYGLTGVLGAVPAAWALRAMDRGARRALARSLSTAGVVGGTLFLADHLLRGGASASDPLGGIVTFAVSLALYIPMVFVIEEIAFRGAFDAYARGGRSTDDRASAVVVSLLWGVWHVPLVLADRGLAELPITLGYHLVIGLLLTFPWRRCGNLAVPGITHALIDAVRDGLAAL